MDTRKKLMELRNNFVRYGVYNKDNSYVKDGKQYRESLIRMRDGAAVKIVMCNGDVESIKVLK